MTAKLHVRNSVPPAGLSTSTALLKEPAVRAGYLSGMTIPRLALAFGVAEYVMQDYVAERRWGWSAAEYRGIHEDARRTVIFTRASRETGGYEIRPISVPRISMHVRALDARGYEPSRPSTSAAADRRCGVISDCSSNLIFIRKAAKPGRKAIKMFSERLKETSGDQSILQQPIEAFSLSTLSDELSPDLLLVTSPQLFKVLARVNDPIIGVGRFAIIERPRIFKGRSFHECRKICDNPRIMGRVVVDRFPDLGGISGKSATQRIDILEEVRQLIELRMDRPANPEAVRPKAQLDKFPVPCLLPGIGPLHDQDRHGCGCHGGQTGEERLKIVDRVSPWVATIAIIEFRSIADQNRRHDSGQQCNRQRAQDCLADRHLSPLVPQQQLTSPRTSAQVTPGAIRKVKIIREKVDG
ncbi:hypothetical protein LOF24_10175 [Sinorhizobium meliloti SM11]|uniref:hypothetical protein n=1 Tax=Rhizobium meliloti TaxID=382 RepID=UPI001F0AA05B|nr:hypothetical protein [Sinorhizobium meliloti]MDE4558429.1 hypothetical protein [Sinorhizobium meliloti SM11]